MKELNRNMWNIPAEAYVVPTNGIVKRDGTAVMGKGVALQAALKYPELAQDLGQKLRDYGNQVFAFLYGDVWIITLPTKEHWRDSSSERLVRTSLRQLVEIVPSLQIESVVLPLIATGCGGLNKEHIKELLNDVLDDTYTLCIQ